MHAHTHACTRARTRTHTHTCARTQTLTHRHLLCCAQLLSRVQLCAIPWTAALQAPLSMGIFQARILEWVAMPSSRGSSQPRDWTQVSPTRGRLFTHLTPTLYIPTFYKKRLDVFCRFPPPRSNFNPLCCRPLLVTNRGWLTLFSYLGWL